jgi:1,4-alpha-glucan branching enzyme
MCAQQSTWRKASQEGLQGNAQQPHRSACRKLPVGAELVRGGGVDFRVWAPKQRIVEVVLVSGPGAPDCVPLSRDADGYFGCLVPAAATGTRYLFRLGGADGSELPDQASRGASTPRPWHCTATFCDCAARIRPSVAEADPAPLIERCSVRKRSCCDGSILLKKVTTG